MNNETFDALKQRIKNDPGSVKTTWYDGHKWMDPQGNWYGWTDCGFCEHIFYAGEEYARHTQSNGEPTEPQLVKPYKAPKPTDCRRLCEWLGEAPKCEPCVFGFIYGCGADVDCPSMTRDEMAETLSQIADKAREARNRLGA